MKTLTNRLNINLFLALLSLTIIVSCKKTNSSTSNTVINNDPSTQTIGYQVSGSANFTLLKAAAFKAGLVQTLESPGPFTVFAPTDDAFKASGIDATTINTLSADNLKTILLYHTITSKIASSSVPAGPNAKVITASGDSVFVTNNMNGVFVNGIKVTKADLPASNGVIHTIAKVLLPASGNIVHVPSADTTLSYLVAAVVRASQGSTNVASLLSSGGIFTVLAPTNNAFRKAGFATVAAINAADPNTLTTILTYHVIAGRVFSSDLTNGGTPATLNGGKLTITLSGSGAAVQGSANASASNITATNTMATNGVVHVIDQVLLPLPGTIAAQVSSNPNFTLLKAAVVKGGLAATLDGAGPFTVFAPSDNAFLASGITSSVISALSVGKLDTILLYHTIAGKILSSQVPAGPNAKVITAGGDSIFVTNNANGVFVNGIPVVTADVPASNGVIHVLNKVLLPSFGQNLVQVASSDTTFSYLVAAVVRASQGSTNVAGLLSSGGIFTVFAPTNNAFRAAGFATVDAINAADPNTLAGILAYHVLPGRVFSSDLTNGATPGTISGGNLTIALSQSGATVMGKSNMTASNIIGVNIMATNGVIHVIDSVLLP